MRRLLSVIFSLSVLTLMAGPVSQERMKAIYEKVRTPYKYGLVVAPEDNQHKFDCPTVFRENGKWYMTFVCYDGQDGTDGRGYETWMAVSDDLLHWRILGKVLVFPEEKTWDANQRGGFPALIDWDWGGQYRMRPYKGKYWMTYIGGPGTGYEAVSAPLSIGVATTPVKKGIDNAHPWDAASAPLMRYDDADAQWWERLTQYKSTVYRMDKRWLGAPFVMFYNAGGKDDRHPKGERIGIALSKDMKHWTRYEGNPVFAHDTDGTITGDAQLVRMDDVFVMFYFSAYNPTREYAAYNTFAASDDLIHWTDWTGKELIYPSRAYDGLFAHKSYVVNWNDTVYHFYCAVNPSGQRGIAVATNRFVGKSETNFPPTVVSGHRQVISLNDGWEITHEGKTFRKDIPFNLDDYYGAMQKIHGNLHGEAVFRKTFPAPAVAAGKRCFLTFEGVGTYADITINGHDLGRYDIGRTSLTLDVTPYINKAGREEDAGEANQLALRVSHPAGITDMPWVCGGCSSEWGFSEGSQPFGIFRPVSLTVTDEVRVQPFGVHVWNNATADSVYIETEIKNYGKTSQTLSLVSKFCLKSGKQVFRLTDEVILSPGETKTVRQASPVTSPQLWSPSHPYLYTVSTIIKRDGKAVESVSTPYGVRTSSWPLSRKDGDNRFFLNGQPLFVNGVCEYEHEFGQSHAFTEEQIEARIKTAKAAGFNAWRDAHQPHNLHYGEVIDREGLLWWPQFSAHIWFDTPEFRESFKRHLRQWVKERRNSPSIILWGLQNESTLPEDFAEECTRIIREMDPMCGSQRLVTTCNGGEGTDWNVVQNWSGTYGGNIDNYADELQQPEQLLNGEYGAWRTVGNHTGEGYTEERFSGILEKKVTLAESVSDSVCGQFLWLLQSHDNPGRRQADEGLRRIDKVGPFNHKGLLTVWGQPTDAYYMYQRHFRYEDAVKATVTIDESPLQGASGYTYLYRLNCGGDACTDRFGQIWMQDNAAWSDSWGDRFGSPYLASQTWNDSLSSTLFKSSRFGRHELRYHFPVSPGRYRVELYFIEPWFRMPDAEGWRLFDVAVNDSTVIRDLDIWAQVHYGRPYKRVVDVEVTGNELKIDFPKVKAGQAMIAAIAVACRDGEGKALPNTRHCDAREDMWAAFNRDILVTMPDSLLPPKAVPVMEVEGKRLTAGRGKTASRVMEWDFSVGVAKVYTLRWRYYNPEGPRKLRVRITDSNGVVYKDDVISFLQTQQKKTKRKMTSITTGSMVNAGRYRVTLQGEGLDGMLFEKMVVE